MGKSVPWGPRRVSKRYAKRKFWWWGNPTCRPNARNRRQPIPPSFFPELGGRWRMQPRGFLSIADCHNFSQDEHGCTHHAAAQRVLLERSGRSRWDTPLPPRHPTTAPGPGPGLGGGRPPTGEGWPASRPRRTGRGTRRPPPGPAGSRTPPAPASAPPPRPDGVPLPVRNGCPRFEPERTKLRGRQRVGSCVLPRVNGISWPLSHDIWVHQS